MNLGRIFVGAYIILFGIIAVIVYIILSKHQKKQQSNLSNRPEQYQSVSSQPKNNAKRKNIIISLVLSLIITPIVGFGLYEGVKIGTNIANVANVSDFKIEGKWKVQSDGGYQMKRGAIVSFDGVHCNATSPLDTYAFYKGGKYDYILDCTFSGTTTFDVKIFSNDHITLYRDATDCIVDLIRVE